MELVSSVPYIAGAATVPSLSHVAPLFHRLGMWTCRRCNWVHWLHNTCNKIPFRTGNENRTCSVTRVVSQLSLG